MVKQPVFLRSMSAPSDLEMIANQDLEFTHASQRYLSIFVWQESYEWPGDEFTFFFLFTCFTFRRRHHPTSHRSSSFTLLQSLAIEDSRDKPTYSVLLGQLFAFIGTTPDQAVSLVTHSFFVCFFVFFTDLFVAIAAWESVVELWSDIEIFYTGHFCRCQAAVSCLPRRHVGDVAAHGSRHLFIWGSCSLLPSELEASPTWWGLSLWYCKVAQGKRRGFTTTLLL